MRTEEYTLKVHYESDHIWAEVKELPGCFACGATVEELREALEEALGMYLSEKPGSCKVSILALNPRPATRRTHIRARLLPV